ncbi:MAG: DUF3137 domain-containing protein [Wenzhouxiangella sp.]|nr:MAG: DUF3137 domain-containing protein [Wenzhouxiangella sp.]
MTWGRFAPDSATRPGPDRPDTTRCEKWELAERRGFGRVFLVSNLTSVGRGHVPGGHARIVSIRMGMNPNLLDLVSSHPTLFLAATMRDEAWNQPLLPVPPCMLRNSDSARNQCILRLCRGPEIQSLPMAERKLNSRICRVDFHSRTNMPNTGTKNALLLTTALLVLVNLIPVIGVLFWDWSVYTLVLLFWAENLIVGAFNVARMWVLWRLRNDSKMIVMIPFFCLHYGLFMLVHLMFLIWMFRPEGESVLPLGVLWVPFLALAVSHGVSFFTHFMGRGEYKEAKPDDLMSLPYARVLVLHVTILVGGFLVAYMGEPLVALIVLVMAKILIDVAAHRREHLRNLTRIALEGEKRANRDFPAWDEPAANRVPDTVPDPKDLMRAIASEARSLEAEHDRYRAVARRDIAILAVAGLIMALAMIIWGGASLIAAFASAAIVASLLGFFRVPKLGERWIGQVNEQVLPALCERVEGMHHEATMRREFLKPFEKLEVIGDQWNRSVFGPFFRGRLSGTDFEFGQATLTRKSGGKNSSTELIFRGLLLRIRLPFEVKDRVLVTGKSMLSGRRHMVNVDLNDETFHDTFATYVAQDHPDPEGLARSVLLPEWRSALVAINQAQSGGSGPHAAIQAGFIHDSLYLTLRRFSVEPVGQGGTTMLRPGREFFQVPLKLFSEPDIESDLAGMVDDLLTAHRIVDQLPLIQGGQA